MSVIPFSPATIEGPPTSGYVAAIRALLPHLSHDELRALAEEVRRLLGEGAEGDFVAKVIRFIPTDRIWTVSEVISKLTKEGSAASSKEIYNAVGYLTRKGRVKRIGYGRYIVDGVVIATSDDLGCESARHEDHYPAHKDHREGEGDA